MLGQVDEMVGGQHVLALLVVAALVLHLVGGHLTLFLVGSMVAPTWFPMAALSELNQLAVLVVESCLGLGLAAEMFERLCVS